MTVFSKTSQKLPIIFCSLVLLAPYSLHAKLHWQDNSFSLLYGNHFEVNPKEQTTLTFEHASGWSFGDLFLFMDLTEYHDSQEGKGFQGELSPRFSLSKLSGNQFSAGPVKDFLVATTIEFGKGNVESFMIGPALDLEIPGFDFFKLNIYKRFTEKNRDGEVIQITPAWSITTEFAGSNLIFDGYIDWNIHDDNAYEDNIHVNPQLKYDLSKRLGFTDKRLLLGIEHSYWKNKYGIKDSPYFDTDQNVTSFIIKAHFQSFELVHNKLQNRYMGCH